MWNIDIKADGLKKNMYKQYKIKNNNNYDSKENDQ